MMPGRSLKMSIVIAIAALSTLWGQSTDSLIIKNSRLKINIHTGIEFNDLGNLKSSFVEIRDYLWAAGIKMPGQLTRPLSSSFGASALFSLKDRMYFGVRFEHVSTKAYSIYREAEGTVDLKSSLTADKFFITGQYILPYHRYFSPLAEMNLGLLSAKYGFTNKIRFYKPFPEAIDEESSGRKNTHILSLFLGAQNSIYENLVLFEKIGYQFSYISGMPVKAEDSDGHAPVTFYTQIDLRGVLLQLGAEYQF